MIKKGTRLWADETRSKLKRGARDRFQRRRRLPLTLSGRVLVVLDESSQTKVRDFTHQVISHQDVGSSQVPVDVVHPLDEGHAVCNLGGLGGAPTESEYK